MLGTSCGAVESQGTLANQTAPGAVLPGRWPEHELPRQHRACALGHVLAGEAEMLVERAGRTGGAEALHGHHVAAVARPAMPAERRGGLDGDAGGDGGREHAVA